MVDSSGTTRPSSLIVSLDPAGVVVGGLLVEDRDNDSSKLERLSFSCSLLFGEGVILSASSMTYPSAHRDLGITPTFIEGCHTGGYHVNL